MLYDLYGNVVKMIEEFKKREYPGIRLQESKIKIADQSAKNIATVCYTSIYAEYLLRVCSEHVF